MVRALTSARLGFVERTREREYENPERGGQEPQSL